MPVEAVQCYCRKYKRCYAERSSVHLQANLWKTDCIRQIQIGFFNKMFVRTFNTCMGILIHSVPCNYGNNKHLTNVVALWKMTIVTSHLPCWNLYIVDWSYASVPCNLEQNTLSLLLLIYRRHGDIYLSVSSFSFISPMQVIHWDIVNIQNRLTEVSLWTLLNKYYSRICSLKWAF